MIKVEHVSKHFGGVHAVNGVSLEVNKGDIVCLIGPSGSGKKALAYEFLRRLTPE